MPPAEESHDWHYRSGTETRRYRLDGCRCRSSGAAIWAHVEAQQCRVHRSQAGSRTQLPDRRTAAYGTTGPDSLHSAARSAQVSEAACGSTPNPALRLRPPTTSAQTRRAVRQAPGIPICSSRTRESWRPIRRDQTTRGGLARPLWIGDGNSPVGRARCGTHGGLGDPDRLPSATDVTPYRHRRPTGGAR